MLPSNSKGIAEVSISKSLIILGANGSGKTRFGTWVELNSVQNRKSHRISAQKSLSMPDNSTPIAIDKASNDLLYGNADTPINQEIPYKTGYKWNSKPFTHMLDDFKKLMIYLFSDHTEESATYLAASKLSKKKIIPPTTKLDLVKSIWERVLPHRELILGGLRIQTKIKGIENSIYNSSEMSDGERVIFYLIGQCLAAPKDGIIIVDEPELHLHKSVQAPLWIEIEKSRPDCLFIRPPAKVAESAKL